MANIKYIGCTTNKNNLEWFYLSSIKTIALWMSKFIIELTSVKSIRLTDTI